MSSHIRRQIFSTRQRLLSTDANDLQAHIHRALIESLEAAESGDTLRTGVLRGMLVSPITSTLTVSVSAGIALRAGGSGSGNDSSVDWLEIRSAETVDLTAHVDGANPRWICIEVEPNDAVETQQLKDVFDPATGTFSSQSLPLVQGSEPTIHVTAGTAAASPAFPAGTSGRIPLGYVYLPAGATEIDTGDFIRCRPLLLKPEPDSVQGGGVSVASAGTDVELHEARATLDGLAMSLTAVSGLDVSDSNLYTNGESYPGGPGSEIVYLYAAQPPYPAGYTLLAPREFRAGGNIYSAGRVPSLPSAMNGTLSGCMVFASTTAPSVVAGEPYDPFGDALAGRTVNDGAWGGGTIPRSLYLGAVLFDGTDLVRQDYSAGEVGFRPSSLSIIPDESETLGIPSSNSGGGNFRLADTLSAAGDQLIPSSARHARLLVAQTCGVGGDGDCDYTVTVGPPGAINELVWQGRGSGLAARSAAVWIHSDDGSFDWSHEVFAGSANTSSITISTIGYRDAILAQR